MLSSNTEFLQQFGWDDFFESQIPDLGSKIFKPARVISEERNVYRLQVGLNQTIWAAITGSLKFKAVSRVGYPAVGDWVLFELPPNSERGVIHQILPRKTTLHRKQVLGGDMQILSTNVDTVFIVTSLNEDLSYRRIERYLAVAQDAGVTPVILLTKSDVYGGDLAEVQENVKKEFPSVDVYVLSQKNFTEANFLAGYLKPGTTSVFLGSSGVGKSTLVNYLIKTETSTEVIKTQDSRAEDGKGRHTTTSRNLYLSRYGGLVIDTPGMRELQLSDHEAGGRHLFADIEELVQGCRFGDCQHKTEPGCAVLKALASAELSDERWKSYLKLQAEGRHGMRKQDKGLAAEDRKTRKKLILEGQSSGRRKRGEPC